MSARWIKLNDVRVKVESQQQVYCLMALYDAPSYILNFDDNGDFIEDYD